MKSEFCDLKRNFGEIKLFPETLDDLWHLKHLIAPGDLVFATTFRSIDSATDKVRPEKAEKKPVRLGIRIEKVEFHHNSGRLRAGGVIEHGPDTGFHHSLNLETGHEISVIKNWTSYDLERIDRAVKASSLGLIHILTVEEGEAELFRLRQFGPEQVTAILGGSGKREGLDSRKEFFLEVYGFLSAITGPVVVAGPGFVKDDFINFLKSKDAELAERCITAETRRIGRGAVQEVIGLGITGRINEDLQLAREVKAIDELLKRISTGGAAAYGTSEVRQAIDYGAVDEVLVCDSLLRDNNISALLEAAENLRAGIVVLSTEFEPGSRLEALGGIAALLRFKL